MPSYAAISSSSQPRVFKVSSESSIPSTRVSKLSSLAISAFILVVRFSKSFSRLVKSVSPTGSTVSSSRLSSDPPRQPLKTSRKANANDAYLFIVANNSPSKRLCLENYLASAAAFLDSLIFSDASRLAILSILLDCTLSVINFMYIASCSINGESEIVRTL